MHVEKMFVKTNAAIPLMAALPYGVTFDEDPQVSFLYDPETQLTRFAGRNFSTCRNDESINPLFGKSKSDTSKDD